MIVAIIQARMGSTRLPGKVLKILAGKPVLWHVIERLKTSRSLDKVIVATTTNEEDDAIENFCRDNACDVYRGSSEDVLSRYYEAAKREKCDTVVRVTSDCPLIDPNLIDLFVAEFLEGSCDYLSNTVPGHRSYPRGFDVEVFSFAALEKAHVEAEKAEEREHVTPYIWRNTKGAFRVRQAPEPQVDFRRPQYRLTLDFDEDYALLRNIYDHFYRAGGIIRTLDVLKYLDEHPDIVEINSFREAEQVHIARV